MGSLHKKITKFSDKYDPGRKLGQAVVGKDRERKLYDQGHFIGHAVEKSYDATKAAEAATTAAANEKAIPLPDEEELARIRRRRSLGGGRASTQLSSGDTFGP